MCPAAVQGIAIKLFKWNSAEKRGWLQCPMSKVIPAQCKESTIGCSGYWVQLCSLKAPTISNKCGPQIKVVPLLPMLVWVQSQLGSSWWTKCHFHYQLQKSSIYHSLFHLRLSRCSCCALIINRNHEDNWKSCLLLRQDKGKDSCNRACCSHDAVFNMLVV